MDFRIKPSVLSELLAKEGYAEGDFDTVSLAGAAKCALSEQPGECEMLFKQIELSKKLHGISEIVILYHDNCGAYGIADPAEEEKTQLSDLASIQTKINQNYPDLKVKLYIIKGVPSGKLSLTPVKI